MKEIRFKDAHEKVSIGGGDSCAHGSSLELEVMLGVKGKMIINPLDTQSRLPDADVWHPDQDGREHIVLNGHGHTVPVRCGRKVPRYLGASVKCTRMPVKTSLVIQNTCYLECRSPACRFQCVQ